MLVQFNSSRKSPGKINYIPDILPFFLVNKTKTKLGLERQHKKDIQP